MAAVLLTLAQAKAHLRITLPPGDPGDADLQLKLDQAESAIRKWLKKQDDPTWTADTVPPDITAGILLLLTDLYEHRGDLQTNAPDVWESITLLLCRRRDPGLA